jgi:hypothetical protein
MKEPFLIYNAIKTPDGTILVSRTRHDYRTHLDANGKEYMVDGGLDYCRRSANGDEVNLTMTDEQPHSVQRDVLDWGTYGVNGDQPLKLIPISQMNTDHIKAVLETQKYMYEVYRNCMEQELKERELNEIYN